MAKDREVACCYYICEGNCKKKHEGTFRKACQKCGDYKPIRHGRAARPNLKREKVEKSWIREHSKY